MATFTFEHIHLRSPDPEETAKFYESMFGATIIRTAPQGKPRVDLDLCGATVFIAQIAANDTGSPPQSPYPGLDHIGLCVPDLDEAVSELKAKGANFTMEPNTIRPGVRIAFMTGPQDVSIEILQRSES